MDSPVLMVLLLVFVVVALICAFKESKVTGLYKANGVYGRIKAYLALDLALVGVLGLAGGVALLISGGSNEYLAQQGMSPLAMFGMGIVCLAIGVAIYYFAYRKCPEPLKKKCIISMVISGMGVAMKIAVFFLPFVWKLALPGTTVTTSAPAEETKTEVYRITESGQREDLRVNSSGDMYFDPDDQEWHKIKK